MIYLVGLFNALILATLFSCSVPDLSDPEILRDAQKEAIPLESLERKLMYGMIPLYVDQNGDPYSGFVKKFDDFNMTTLGFLKKGRKEGLWISSDNQGTKRALQEWKEDRLEGIFQGWHAGGGLKVSGQTKDGEVDGEWVEYYLSGQLASRSLNRVGHLVSIEVWHPNGEKCNESKVEEGTGQFFKYFADGRINHHRTFQDGVETSIKVYNHR